MNHVFLIGRLAADPELRTTANGVSVASFRIGVNRRFNKDVTDFINISAWRSLGELCAKYLVKGQQVAVVGELHIDSYDARDGSGKRYRTEVVADNVEFLAKPAGARSSGGYSSDALNAVMSGDPQPHSSESPKKDDGALSTEELNGVILEDENLPF